MMAAETAQTQLNKSKVKRRSKTVLTLAQKIAVINEYEIVLNTRKLAAAYGCGRTQIQNIIKRKMDYLEQWSSNGDLRKIKYKQRARLMILGAVVFEWIQRSRSQGDRVYDDQILKAGEAVAKLMNHPNFRATQTWLKRLKKVFKIECLEPLPICELAEEKKSLNLLDILLEFRKDKEKLRERLPQSYIMYHELEPEDFRRHFTDEVITLNDDCISQTSILEGSLNEMENKEFKKVLSSDKYQTSNDGSIINEKEFEENSKNALTFDGNQTSTVSDGFLTEIEIEDDSQNILSFEVRLSDGKIVAKPKTNQKDLSTKDLNLETISVKIEEPTAKESNMPSISSYKEALSHLGPIEQFALLKEDIRAVGIINQLENLFAERMESS